MTRNKKDRGAPNAPVRTPANHEQPEGPDMDQHTKPLYTLINGEPMISMEGMALLMDLPADVVKAEWKRQGGTSLATFNVPKSWIQRGHRIRKEVSAALGYEPGMKETIDYLAAKAGTR